MIPTRQHAAIRINPKCYEYSDQKFEKLLIHEILHPLFNPILKEHEVHMEYWGADIGAPLKGAAPYIRSHKDKVETCLDHLANVIYNIDHGN